MQLAHPVESHDSGLGLDDPNQYQDCDDKCWPQHALPARQHEITRREGKRALINEANFSQQGSDPMETSSADTQPEHWNLHACRRLYYGPGPNTGGNSVAFWLATQDSHLDPLSDYIDVLGFAWNMSGGSLVAGDGTIDPSLLTMRSTDPTVIGTFNTERADF